MAETARNTETEITMDIAGPILMTMITIIIERFMTKILMDMTIT